MPSGDLVGSIQVTRAALPHLRVQGGGRIIQLSTYGGQAANPGACMYHAARWGIEGFMESTAKDVAPFGIDITIVEPGGARTEFRYGSLRTATPMPEYDGSPAAMTRGAGDRSRPALGDPALMAARTIDSVGQTPAPAGWSSAATPTASCRPPWRSGWPRSRPSARPPSDRHHRRGLR
jgi:NAD(P)-dependent dehydrogenase (short-subunit alcohol dehydrogenase family)